MGLLNEAEAEQNAKETEPTEETFTVKEHTRKKKRTVEELTADLPVREVVLKLPDELLICGCGAKMVPIGKEFLRQELDVIPKQVFRVMYYTETYACKE